MRNIIIPVLALLVALIPFNEVKADDYSINTGLQYALKRLGYYDSEIDGENGPKTRAAIRRYAEDRGIDNDEVEVIKSIGRFDAPNWRIDLDARLKDEALKVLESKLNDFESARIKFSFVNYFYDGGDIEHYAVCGEVNAKNKFGAYTGYKYMNIILFKFKPLDALRSADTLGIGDRARDLCFFGYTLGFDLKF